MQAQKLISYKKWPHIFLLFLMSMALVQCSGGGGNPNGVLDGDLPIGVAPNFLIETATEGTLRAELTVYGPDGQLVHSEDLRINVETGEIFSTQFKLDRGFTYTFLITFYFSKPGLAELPVAMVLKTLTTDDSFLTVQFDAAEVLTALAQISPELSASVSSSILPNLDMDGDGFSNFAEVLEGSDPYDADDVPLPPEIEALPIFDSVDDVVEFRVVFADTSGVATIKPVGDLVCGYFDWKVTPLDPKGKRAELHVKFNLYSHGIQDGDTVHFQYQVSDKLGISKVHTISVADVGVSDFIPAALNRPEILVISPEDGQSVSDFIIVEAMACHRNGVSLFKVNNFIDFVDQAPSEDDLIVGTIPTNDLNANQPIEFLAQAINGVGVNTKTVTVIVDDLNPIKIDAPIPGETLGNGFTLVAHVDKNAMPDVTQFFIEKITPDLEGNGTEVFSLNQLKFDVNSLPEAFTGQVFDVTQVTASKFYVHFVAIGPNSGRKERTVSYILNVNPQIFEFDVYLNGPHACIEGEGIELNWQVDNIGEAGDVFVGGQEVIGPIDYKLFGNTVLTGLSLNCASSIELQAIRYVQDIAGGGVSPVDSVANIQLDQISINSINQSNEARLLSAPIFQLNKAGSQSGNINSFNWRVEIQEWTGDFSTTKGPLIIRKTNDILDMTSITGQDLQMQYWGNYTVVFKLMAPNSDSVVLSQSQEFAVTYHHPNIVGWWGMESFIDFDGLFGFPSLTSNCILGTDCYSFDGTDDGFRANVFDGTVLDPVLGNNTDGGTPLPFTAELWVKFSDLTGIQPILVKDGQYGFVKLTDHSLQFFVTEDDGTTDRVATIPTPGFNTSSWFHITGVYPASGKPRLYVNVGTPGIAANAAASINDVKNSREDLFFGKNNIQPDSDYFSGQLDEVKIYTIDLPLSDIKSSCNFVSQGICPLN